MEWTQNQSNKNGVGLFLEITEGRSLYFTPRETLIFGYLFDLADTDDDGLVGANDGGHALLGRARLPPSTLQRLWSEAGGESPEKCLARPQWFVLLALVALAQAGLPYTLRDLLHTCDVVSAPKSPYAQAFQQQQPGGSGSSNGGHAGRVRPIPDFFLDGGIPPPPPPSSSPSAGGSAGSAQVLSAAAGGRQQQQHRTGGKSARGRNVVGISGPGGHPHKGKVVGSWDYYGGGGWEEGGGGNEHSSPGSGRGGGEVGDGYQLEVTVYSHRVVGEGYGSHTEYTVLANASLPGFARREMEVARRFSDFRWLHSCFQAIPGVLPPPLPPSKWAGSSSRDFVAERMKGLQRYMTRVAEHPILSRHYAFQVFLEGTQRGLRAAKALLPARIPGSSGGAHGTAAWGDTFSPSMAGGGGTPVSPALSSSPGTTPPDESAGGAGFVRRRFSLGGADDMYVPGGGAGGIPTAAGGLVVAGGLAGVRQGQRRSVSFGGSSDESSSHNGGPGGALVVRGAGGWAGAGAGWPLSVVANVGYEAYGNYVSTSVSTSLTSIKGVLGAVKTKAKSAVGLGAGPAPIAVEQDPLYEAEVARIEDLVAPVTGAVKIMESAAVLKRGVGYEMSRLGHYLTQVASLEESDGFPPAGGVSTEEGGDIDSAAPAAAEGDKRLPRGHHNSSSMRYGHGGVNAGLSLVAAGVPAAGGGGRAGGLAKAEQVLGQRMERVATAWLEAIDQEESDFLDPLREQLGYLASAKEVHRGRGRALDALQAGNASLQRNKQRLHAARAQGDAHMASVSTTKMEAAEERMTCAHTRAGLIAQTFKGEAKRFHECRRAEGVLAVLELARAQALFARKANAAWKQVLEDINPTDDELRESQQRVRLPKREARIGAGGGRAGGSGGSTAGVIGGWLGAAATVGLSTASAGLSTVTGVAGATASAGFSTVTGVAGAMAGRVSAGAGAAGGKGTAGGGGGPVAETAPAAGVPGAATEPDFRGREVDASGPITNDHHGAAGSDGGTGQATVVTQGSGRDADEEMGFDGAGLVTRQPPVGVVSAGVDIVSGQLQDVDVQSTTATKTVTVTGETATAPSSSSSHQLTDDSWELNIERPPPDAGVERASATSPVPAADERGGDAPISSPGRHDDSGHPNGRPLRREEDEPATSSGSAAGGDKIVDEDDEVEGWAAAAAVGWPGSEAEEPEATSAPGEVAVVATGLESLSLDDEAGTSAPVGLFPPVDPQSQRGSSKRSLAEGDVKASAGGAAALLTTSNSRGGGAVPALSLMDSLEALSSSGVDSVPESGGHADSSSSGGDDGARGVAEGGEGKGDDIAGLDWSLAAVEEGEPEAAAATSAAVEREKSPVLATTQETTTTAPASPTPAAAVTISSASAKKKKKKKNKAAKQAASAASNSSKVAEDSESKSTTSPAEGGTTSDDAGTDPATGSGSGSSSRGFGTISAATTVVRLAGSPNPPLQRGTAGSGDSGNRGGGDAVGGLRRLTPSGGSRDGLRGRSKP